ncbi:acyl-[ACP]--phospholipid O-acyltransferase [Cocleimonas sp. KMM 6892]|uniref:acyl-[ACP]--phospholipid O-acyltransferase n=1 Tax=unclassified Cocleimonas TaxID=2639732 RepID=UPI002DBF4973|nr:MULTISPECIES: acyl-[ACP]--phospholipid O-acyltransferase [unclassified Cocleimonas]MEB8431843.1 acyl-[ACP]--phospholipid O-acyltransferase [Cocleimonas sp. KMM 6892]MEC4715071.1 acyl-[ACP]--phospholipid O-acyltransferase [Cocleimonas sp. KMM 6895]MEC4744115.1 acyl-[ACP]--phospholipid O-acyltransferase [Cocleimonas sp. KMM 6896]
MKNALKVTGLFTFLAVAFLNAFVDLGHKIIIQNTIFKNYDGSELIVLTSIVNALILLPFILLFTPTGYISDKYAKNSVMRVSAWVALGITLLITFSYYQGWFWVAFAMTFLLAMQSAFYSPSKYGYVKGLVGDRRLAQANGLLQAVTTTGILLGTFFFSILFEKIIVGFEITDKDSLIAMMAPLGWVLVGLTTIELVLAYRLPQTNKTNHKMKFRWDDYIRGRTQVRNIRLVRRQPYIWLSILGLSIFWAISQVVLATYPAYAKEFLGITNTAMVQGLMAFAGIGVMIGSLIAGRVSRDHIETGLVPVGAIGITISLILIRAFDSSLLQALNFMFLGVMGGFIVVPLNALLQYHAQNNQLGRVLATNNLIQFSVMLLFLAITTVLSYYKFGSTGILWGLALIAFIGTLYAVFKIPESLLRFIVARIFAARYRMKVLGFENLPHSGGMLLLGNHISFVDWALVQIASPRQLKFVIERGYYERWYLNGVLKMFGAIPINSGDSAESLDMINKLLKDGKSVCLFPEGTISRTGQLSEFKRGYQRAIEGTNAKIVPFYLHGLWGSRFSRSSGFLKDSRQSGFKRDVIVAFGKPLPAETTPDQLKRRVFDLSFASWQKYSKTLDPIPVSWLKTAKRMSFQMAATDITGEPVSHHKFITGVFAFSSLIKKNSPEKNIGILVPASVGGAITNMAVMAAGKTAVNLNFTSSPEAIQGSIKSADIKTVYTSKKFILKLEQRGIKIKEILPETKLIYLEEFKEKLSKARMLFTLLSVMLLPTRILQWVFIKPIKLEDTAAILFSSGSEGNPKGVELSHLNLAANSRQIADTLNTREDDVVMSTLPTFHAFGLLATTFMPLSEGIPIICHPDPTDVVTIAKGVARHQATVLFGTSTFLRLYTMNKKVHPLMLRSLRLVIAGAERLNPDTRDAFTLKFNKQLLEGYGTTETSPVAAVNIPDELDTNYWKPQLGNKLGTVGMPLPGTSLRIVDPHTLEELATGEDGLILIGGPQVMKGYLNQPDKTAEVIVEMDKYRWYKSGDKGHLDSDGFLTIVDRYSRFAKLGGEMVSLSAVEEKIRGALGDPELELVAVNLPDDKKGEKVTLLIVNEMSAREIKKALIDAEMNPLMIPSAFINVNAVPTLGSGKTDFATSKKVALGEL